MPTVADLERALARAKRERDERILRLVAQKMTYEYIAHAEGISRARVEQIVRRAERETQQANGKAGGS